MKAKVHSFGSIVLEGAADNPSGIFPTEYNVLIRPNEAPQKVGSIFIPETTREREQFAQKEGVIVAVSPLAFTYEADLMWGPKPAVGDRVAYAKYAGFDIVGKDGVTYKVVKDKDICAVLK